MAGEWFKADTEAVISQALQTGGGPNVSDAYTINGLPGPLYNCSANGIHNIFYLLLALTKRVNIRSNNSQMYQDKISDK